MSRIDANQEKKSDDQKKTLCLDGPIPIVTLYKLLGMEDSLPNFDVLDSDELDVELYACFNRIRTSLNGSYEQNVKLAYGEQPADLNNSSYNVSTIPAYLTKSDSFPPLPFLKPRMQAEKPRKTKPEDVKEFVKNFLLTSPLEGKSVNTFIDDVTSSLELIETEKKDFKTEMRTFIDDFKESICRITQRDTFGVRIPKTIDDPKDSEAKIVAKTIYAQVWSKQERAVKDNATFDVCMKEFTKCIIKDYLATDGSTYSTSKAESISFYIIMDLICEDLL
jgi:hypothetical protein